MSGIAERDFFEANAITPVRGAHVEVAGDDGGNRVFRMPRFRLSGTTPYDEPWNPKEAHEVAS